jgi:peroxiredoxin
MRVSAYTRLCGALMLALLAPHANAALEIGAIAPNFTAPASIGGSVFTFSLADALKKGPVVLYFYPAAFTKGCTIEAHEFADAVDEYKALGATVIGVSRDNIDKLNEFSVSECRSKFAVAADPKGVVINEYDASMHAKPELADRISYVIAPDGKVLYEYASLDPEKHVSNTLEAVKKYEASGH